jgi:hypothetical protein
METRHGPVKSWIPAMQQSSLRKLEAWMKMHR